jgi:hypothetical protein
MSKLIGFFQYPIPQNNSFSSAQAFDLEAWFCVGEKSAKAII